ncbi:MAG: HEPN domain-containing protein [Byssovorax sp.]
MVADLLIANLLRIAREDLDGARLLAASSNRNAAYLCEQAAEKIIRAVLTSEGKHAGIRHQLDEMVKLVPEENPLKPGLREIEELAAYATAFRYPTSSGKIPMPPPGTELGALINKVESVLTDAVSRFGVELAKKGAPAKKPGPIR